MITLAIVGAVTAAPDDAARSGEKAVPAQGDPAACAAECDTALEACRAAADAAVERCRTKAFEPCEEWCPCDQFIGAAHFACLLECERCEDEAEDIAADCPPATAAKAECATVHGRCRKQCDE